MNSDRDGLARSVQVRLARHARLLGADPNLVLTRYAIERFLYRLSRSRHADRFVLKGALLMLAWFGGALRPTRDADLLGFGNLHGEDVARIFADVCTVEAPADGMVYFADSVHVKPIRIEDSYGGQRVSIRAKLGVARLGVQVDVGIGDVIVPPPPWLDYPSLLNLPRPRLRAYSPETVIAEKFHAIAILGSRNTRMKDYFDLLALARQGMPDVRRLGLAIAATFDRRGTDLPEAWPTGLSDRLACDVDKQLQWMAFLTKNRLSEAQLPEVFAAIRDFIAEPLAIARQVTAMEVELL